ncbi:uncharacterized protein LOC113305962 [Papaver somniferum]|uniref:uncharacterized protein LOC113305962 n=1 Tax=Papaver somniferum TaxID=3469 RepID=UPI000E6F8ADF|nr:uncharacterized protein LOC113305962 [Papaver somniferum]
MAAGYGFVCIDDHGDFIYAEAKGLGIATNYIAEKMVIAGAAEWALQNNKLDLRIKSDSKADVSACKSEKLPWFVQVRWSRIKELIRSIVIVHSLREVNFSADSMANKGAGLERGATMSYTTKPAFIHALESPEDVYYRFC